MSLSLMKVRCINSSPSLVYCMYFVISDGAIVETKGEDGIMDGDEGEGWEVGDDELELPPDLVSLD